MLEVKTVLVLYHERYEALTNAMVIIVYTVSVFERCDFVFQFTSNLFA